MIKYVRAEVSRVFVFVIVKNGDKSSVCVRANTIKQALALVKYNGEILEIYSFESSDTGDKEYHKLFGRWRPAIQGKYCKEWVDENSRR